MNRQQRLLIIAIIPILFILRLVYQHHHIERVSDSSIVRYFSERQKVYDQWQKYPYRNVDNSYDLDQSWASAHADLKVPTSSLQHQKLLHDSLALIRMWSSDNFAVSYRDYVTVRNPINNRLAKGQDGVTSTALRRIVSMLGDDKYNHPFISVAPSATTIEYNFVSKDKRPIQSSPIPGQRFSKSFGWNHLDSPFEFEHGFQYQYNKGETIPIATVVFYAQSRKSKKVQPYSMRMWWCKEASEWRPYDIEWANADTDVYPIIP